MASKQDLKNKIDQYWYWKVNFTNNLKPVEIKTFHLVEIIVCKRGLNLRALGITIKTQLILIEEITLLNEKGG
jgi:hypothetical protein